MHGLPLGTIKMSRLFTKAARKLPKCITAIRTSACIPECLVLHPKVQEALKSGRPVVALESTIITHGLPFPQNLNMALEVESIVRQGGAVPATVALLNGRAHVGLAEQDIRLLAEKKEHSVKVSRRDIAFVLSQGGVGGTTISATMLLAHMAGIDIFVTGGLGGVHRGGEVSMDVSADLTELGRTPVAVICSGVKSILDIGRTLEYLETQGVLVASYGGQDDFPAFFTARSGFKAPYKLTSAKEVADVIEVSSLLGLKSGMVIAVPVPETNSGNSVLIEESIQAALREAEEKNVVGKEITPFVLARVCELSKGASLEANLALVFNNAQIGASIAVELAHLRRQRGCKGIVASLPGSARQQQKQNESRRSVVRASLPSLAAGKHKQPVVVGGTNLDLMTIVKDTDLKFNGATYSGSVHQSCGGVGRNLADGLARLGCEPIFLSAIGNDQNGELVQRACLHMDWSKVKVCDGPTAVYSAFLCENGDMLFGVGDMDIHTEVDVSYVSVHESHITEASFVCVDGNIPTVVISYILKLCKQHGITVYFEPTDVYKAKKPFEGNAADCITITKPNFHELEEMHRAANFRTEMNASRVYSEALAAVAVSGDLASVLQCSSLMCRDLVDTIPLIFVTLGKRGVLVCRSLSSGMAHQLGDLRGGRIVEADKRFEARHYDAPAVVNQLSSSGAGDSFGAALMGGLHLRYDGESCIRGALRAAQLSLQSYSTVSRELDVSVFQM